MTNAPDESKESNHTDADKVYAKKVFLNPQSAETKELVKKILLNINRYDKKRKEWEPNAASVSERLRLLKEAHAKGIYTWVSMEPYPTPNLIEQDLQQLLASISFVDKIIFGRTNYSKEVSAYGCHRAFYNEKAQEVIAFCKKHGISYHIKDGTLTPDNI